MTLPVIVAALSLLLVTSEAAAVPADLASARTATDPLAIRQLLAERDFPALEAWLEHAREMEEREPISEAEEQSFRAFRELTPFLARALYAWGTERPDSSAARVALAEHFVGEAWNARGKGLARDTTPGGREKMRVYALRAIGAAREAAQIDSRWANAWRVWIEAARLAGDPEAARSALDEALAAAPAHYGVRREYSRGLAPRWGGSLEALDAFANESQAHVAANSRLRTLLGVSHHETAWKLGAEGRYEEALAEQDVALEFGDEGWFHYKRSLWLHHLGRNEEALAAVERALSLDPWKPDFLVERARLITGFGRVEEALEVLDLAMKIEPRNRSYPSLRQELVWWQAGRDFQEQCEEHPVAARIYWTGIFLEQHAASSAFVALCLWALWRTRSRWPRAGVDRDATAAPLTFGASEAGWLLLRAYVWVALVYHVTDVAYDQILGALEQPERVVEAAVMLVGFIGTLGFAHRWRVVSADLWKVWVWVMPCTTLFVQFHVDQFALADWPLWSFWHVVRLPAYVCLFLYGYRSEDLWTGSPLDASRGGRVDPRSLDSRAC